MIPLKDKPITIQGSSPVEYIDGTTEFDVDNWFVYSIDYTKGYLYLRDKYPVDVTIDYWRNEKYLLDGSDFEVSSDGTFTTITSHAYDPKANYRFNYNIVFPVDSSTYQLNQDNKTISLLPKSIINEFAGFSQLTGKLLKVSYLYKDITSTLANDIYNYLTQIIPELSIVYSEN